MAPEDVIKGANRDSANKLHEAGDIMQNRIIIQKQLNEMGLLTVIEVFINLSKQILSIINVCLNIIMFLHHI